MATLCSVYCRYCYHGINSHDHKHGFCSLENCNCYLHPRSKLKPNQFIYNQITPNNKSDTIPSSEINNENQSTSCDNLNNSICKNDEKTERPYYHHKTRRLPQLADWNWNYDPDEKQRDNDEKTNRFPKFDFETNSFPKFDFETNSRDRLNYLNNLRSHHNLMQYNPKCQIEILNDDEKSIDNSYFRGG